MRQVSFALPGELAGQAQPPLGGGDVSLPTARVRSMVLWLLLLAIASILLGVSSAIAQDQSEQSRPAATKLEAFQARTGTVLIRGYTTVGTI